MANRLLTATLSAVCALAAPLTAAAVAPPAANAQVVQSIATEPLPSKISAFGGVLAWSHWDGTAFQLMARYHGHNQVLPVAPRSVSFDVDVGPDTHGRAVAVYSRCRHEQAAWMLGVTMTRFVAPGGCVLYRYDFATARERAISGIVGGGSFYLPTVWKNDIAYVRVRGAGTPSLYAQPLTAARRHRIVAVGLPTGPAGGPGPVSLDLRAGELAVAWDTSRTSQFDSAVFVDTVPTSPAASPTQLTLAAESSDTRAPALVGFPELARAGMYYGSFDGSTITPSGDSFGHVQLDGSGATSAPAPHALRAQTRDGSTTYAIFGPYLGTFSNCGLSPCSLVAVTGTAFKRRGR